MIDVVFAFPDGQMHSTEVDSAGTVRTLRRAAEDAAPGYMTSLGLQLCDTELLDEEALCDTGLCAGDTVKVTCLAPSCEEAVESLNNIAGGDYTTCPSLQWPAVLAADDKLLMLLLTCAKQPDWFTTTRLIARGEVGLLAILAQRYEISGRDLTRFVLALDPNRPVYTHNGWGVDYTLARCWDASSIAQCQSCVVDDVQEVLQTVLSLRKTECNFYDESYCHGDAEICLRRGLIRYEVHDLVNTDRAEAVDLCLQHNLTPPMWWLRLERPDGVLALLEGAARTGRIAVLECLLEEGLLSCRDLAVSCCQDGNVFHLALHCSVFLQRLRAFHAYAWQWCGCVGDEEEQLVRALEQDDGHPSVLDSAIDRNVGVGAARQSSAHCLQLVAGWIRSKRPQQTYAALWRCGVVMHPPPRRDYVIAYDDYWSDDVREERCVWDTPSIAGDTPVAGYGKGCTARPQRSRKRPNRTQYLRRRMDKRKSQARAHMRSVKCDLLWG